LDALTGKPPHLRGFVFAVRGFVFAAQIDNSLTTNTSTSAHPGTFN
jgi:hypothetical protein